MPAIETAGAAIGAGVVNNIMDIAFGEARQKQNLRGQKAALAQSNEAQMDMWNKTNYSAQVEHLKKAGLNPGLLYGMGGTGGATTGGGGANVDRGHGQGMDIAGAAQLALIKAQTENVEADTANKRSNVPVNEATVPKLQQDTKTGAAQEGNIKAQTGLTEVDKRIREMQEGILEATQYYEMGKVQEEWSKLVGEARSAGAKGTIDTATIENKIKQETIRTVGMQLENAATSKGIELTDQQIAKLKADIEIGYKDAETGRWNAESNATNANTGRNRLINDISETSGLDIKSVTDILQTIAIGAQFGKGGVQKGKTTPPAKGSKYDKWGTWTAPKSRGGVELK